VAEHAGREGPLLPILHDVQHELGCVDAASEAQIALLLNLSRADVHGVVSFYHDFHSKPDLRPEVQICRAEACKARGVEALIANALNLSRADVHGVVSFYHDFHAKADPRPVVQICRAEACKARGVEALIPAAEQAAGERVKLTTVYCLGLCSAGPSARVGDRLHARLDAAGLAQVIENA